MHVSDGGLGFGFGEVEDVGCAAVHAGCCTLVSATYWEWWAEMSAGACGSRLTLSVDGEIQVVNLAVLAKDFVQVVLVDILGQALDDNLH
jgi:hypothetical protein